MESSKSFKRHCFSFPRPCARHPALHSSLQELLRREARVLHLRAHRLLFHVVERGRAGAGRSTIHRARVARGRAVRDADSRVVRRRRPDAHATIVAACGEHERLHRVVPGDAGQVAAQGLRANVVQQSGGFAIPDVYITG